MREIHKPNLALTTELIKRIMDLVKKEVTDSKNRVETFNLIVFAFYMVLSYVLSLRGSECVMLDLAALNKGLEGKRDYLVIGLRGKVKGETIERDPSSRVASLLLVG